MSKGGTMDNSQAQALGSGIAAIFLIIAGVVSLVILLVILRMISNAMAGVPEKHRPMTPGQIYWLLVPLFNLYWNFRIFPPMMEGYAAALQEKKVTVSGDGGAGLAKAFCITYLCCIIPFVNMLALPAALVLFIIVMVKAFEAKKLLA